MFPFEYLKKRKDEKARIEAEAELLVVMLKEQAYAAATDSLQKVVTPEQNYHLSKVRRRVMEKLGLPHHVDTATRYLLNK
jgi:hypothetical protein